MPPLGLSIVQLEWPSTVCCLNAVTDLSETAYSTLYVSIVSFRRLGYMERNVEHSLTTLCCHYCCAPGAHDVENLGQSNQVYALALHIIDYQSSM